MICQRDFYLADLFCGAGGTSTGAVEALEYLGYHPQLTAVNHWQVAVATHEVNHSEARHLCMSLDSINPRDLFKPGQLKLLWASPECTHHSVARGGKPINDQSRATAWCVVRWAEALLPDTILVENVPEFRTWGPIGSNGKPLKSRKGEIFRQWIKTLESIGYTVDHRILVAADFGDPTTRRRLFVQAQRGRRKIVWPNPTHAKTSDVPLLGLRPWPTAREQVIDWSLSSQSIFERKKPLSPKTIKRIWAGLEKFGLKPFIVPKESGEKRVRSIERPLQTVKTEDRGIGLAEPYIVTWDQTGSPTGENSIDDPLTTVCTKARHGVAEPILIEMKGSSPKQFKAAAKSVDQPVAAITTKQHVALVEPFIVKLKGGTQAHIDSSASDISEPVPTIHANGQHIGLAEPFLINTAHAGDRKAMSIDDPMPAVAGNRGDVAICEPMLIGQQSCAAARPVTEPAPTVATAGAIGLVAPYLIEYYGNGQSQSVDDPLPTVTTKQRFGLVRPVVVMDGKRYLLDIRFRMLQPHELAAAQGFRKDYKFTGNKTEQVKQIGNAVPRRLARALVTAAVSQKADISGLLERYEFGN